MKITLDIIETVNPLVWALENPMSRIHKLIPELGSPTLKFDPCDYAGFDPNPYDSQYKKRTWLWGKFNLPEKKYLPPIQGSKMHIRYGGSSERTKELRSLTPLGFAYAFFEANHLSYNTGAR